MLADPERSFPRHVEDQIHIICQELQWPLIGRESDLDHAIGLVESGAGLALLGQAGVGKSRLLHELGDRAEQSGKTVVRTVATESTRSIAFAPFVELLPEPRPHDRLAFLGTALAALRERNRGRGLILTVDDAHHLDPSSLALLIQVAASGAATICMTARAGETIEPDLVDMWTNGAIQRLDVTPLDRGQLEVLITTTLGDCEPGLIEKMWRLTGGNPLVLHELIEGAIDTTIVRGADGVWRAVGPLARSTRLGDLIRSRVATLQEPALTAMQVIAIGAPLPVAVASRVSQGHLQGLEAIGLVRVVNQADVPVIVPSHPLYGEVMVQNLAETTRLAGYARLVEAGLAEPDAVDPVRVALWQVESGTVFSPSLAVVGAVAALNRHDPVLAERLVRPVGSDDPEVALVLGRALSYQQRWQEAEEVLRGIRMAPGEIASAVASVRGQNLAFGLGRVREGRNVLAAAAESESDADVRGRLLNERAMVSAISGDFTDAREATHSVLSDPTSAEVSKVSAYLTLTVAQAMTGDSRGLEESVPIALQMSDRVAEVLPFAGDQIEIMQLTGYLNAGRLEDAWQLAAGAISAPDRGDALLPTWLSAAGLVLDAAGAQDLAVGFARRALEAYVHGDPFGLESQARGAMALAKGQLGAHDADDIVADLPLHLPAPRLSIWVDRGKAWASIARGDIDGAVEILREGGRRAVNAEHFAWACLCFHDVVRVGRPELVLADLEALPPMPGAHFTHALIEHARSVHAKDAGGVVAVAAKLTGMKARLLAAEAWSHAASMTVVETAACRHALMSIALQRSCGAPKTPALATRPNLVSAREVETALLAAEGETSAGIGAALFLSPRTVENHLQAVYRKCGIPNRGELRTILRPILDAGFDIENE